VFDSAFRVWRILGGGKIRQTLCVLFLAKILLNYSFYFILAAAACPPSAEKIYKRCFCSFLRGGEGKRTKGNTDTERTKRVEVEAARVQS